MRWIREGGLFVIVCNLITVFKYILLQFLPAAFANMPKVDFGWPGIEVTMLGATFKWNILGYDAELNCTPFVRQYGILSNKWGVFLCQKEYQTNDIRQNSKNW